MTTETSLCMSSWQQDISLEMLVSTVLSYIFIINEVNMIVKGYWSIKFYYRLSPWFKQKLKVNVYQLIFVTELHDVRDMYVRPSTASCAKCVLPLDLTTWIFMIRKVQDCNDFAFDADTSPSPRCLFGIKTINC